FFQFVAVIGFAQKSNMSSHIKSKFVNENGVVQFVEFEKTSALNVERRSDVLKEFLKASENTSFTKMDSHLDRLGFLHETFQQYYNDIPVEFGIYKAHLEDGKLSAMNGEYYPILEIDTKPSISIAEAVTIAHKNVGDDSFKELTVDAAMLAKSNPTLVVFPIVENINATNRLAYRLEVDAEQLHYKADVYVDAHTGVIIFENSKIHKLNVPASGTTLYNNVQDFTAETTASGYRLRQTANGNGIQTFNATSGVQNATDVVSSSTSFNNIDDAAVQVHWGTEQAHEYFLQKHGRNSFDNNGALIKSYITPQSAVANAHWTGSVLHYSMGNGSTVSPLTSLDVVGHEITHAVVDHSADLIFAYQSGAINESYADIFGEMVENYGQGSNDWLCGASCVQNGFRSMSDPKANGQPDTYLGQYWQTTADDNFGVHTNSGVHNKWFYLLAEGGTGTNDNGYNYSVNGIGIDKASKIAYRTLTLYLTPYSKFHYACEVSLYAASQLYGGGSAEQIAAAEAWRAVGVLQQPSEWSPPTAPLNLVNYGVATPYNVKLSWDASTDNVGVLGYAVLLDGNKVGVTVNTSDTITKYLQANINHEFTVRAFDVEGNYSAASNIVNIIFDNINPTIPTNLTASNITQTTIDLSWTGSTDNVGVVGYNIYRFYPGIPNVLIGTVFGATTYTVDNLTPDTNYPFVVEAIDAAGNESGQSNIASATTLATCVSNSGLTFTFITDPWYPFETSWDIKDATNTIIASGANYYIPNQTNVYNIAAGPGSYTLNVYDSFGDGIIPPGGYTLESNVVIATQPNYGMGWSTLTHQFCLNTNPSLVSNETNMYATQTIAKSSGIIFPNPVLDRLYFKNLDNENKTISVVDLTGKIFIKGFLDSQNSLDVSNLQTGIYILKISGIEETESYKFMKK
ncbi:M4 family metallopeptidase, partial [Saprospiraceae bacterium]|nr:M4 family metallopeptidase [Saprospiraceae bacterium]